MNKYIIIGIIGLLSVAIGVIAYTFGSSYGVGCVEVTDDMSIKKAKAIAKVCGDEIATLQEQFNELSEQQAELSRLADEKRSKIKSSPVNLDDTQDLVKKK